MLKKDFKSEFRNYGMVFANIFLFADGLAFWSALENFPVFVHGQRKEVFHALRGDEVSRPGS